MEPELISVDWNQDHGCFVCGLTNGFRVYNSDPLTEKQRREFQDGGIGVVEMLFRCNYLAFIGGGRFPRYPTNKILIWDDRKKKCVIELEFKSEVKAVKLRRDKIIAILESKVLVYSFQQAPELLLSFSSHDNPGGICALCPDTDRAFLVFPGTVQGQLQVVDLNDGKRAPSIILAHETQLQCIAVNETGTMVATASTKGTLIRIFNIDTSQRLYELRRGATVAQIQGINFNMPSTMLCASSDKGTIHVFSLKEDETEKSTASSFGKLLAPHKSFAKLRLQSTNILCAFTSDSSAIIAISKDGSYYKCLFNAQGASTIEKKQFLSLTSSSDE